MKTIYTISQIEYHITYCLDSVKEGVRNKTIVSYMCEFVIHNRQRFIVLYKTNDHFKVLTQFENM